MDFTLFCEVQSNPRFTGPRCTEKKPAEQTFYFISLLQKPRLTGHKTTIIGIFFPKIRKIILISSIKFTLQDGKV